jgi:putative tricarboxylic transport membrane protein
MAKMRAVSRKAGGNLVVAGCTIALATAYLIASLRIRDVYIVDPLGPKAFPLLLGLGLLICGVSLGLTTLVGILWDTSDVDLTEEAKSHPFAVVLVGGWLLAYYLVFETLGFLLATMIFLLGMTSYFNRGRWWVNVAVSVLFPVCLDLIFSYVLGRAPAPGLFSF